jgi:hypothetical protein
LPLPISVAGSGLGRRCRNSPTIVAPALVASSRSSASDSSAENSSKTWSAERIPAAEAASLAARADGGTLPAGSRCGSDSASAPELSFVGERVPPRCAEERDENSTPTKNACSGRSRPVRQDPSVAPNFDPPERLITSTFCGRARGRRSYDFRTARPRLDMTLGMRRT